MSMRDVSSRLNDATPADWDKVGKVDMVNAPPHYNTGGIETIEGIRAAIGREHFISYCQGNVLKYVWRWKHKGGLEDLRKARFYLERMIKEELGE